MNRSRTATWVKLMAGTAVLSLSLAACGSDDSGEAGDDTSPSASESDTSADETFTNDRCSGGSTSADTFKVGGILPLTGNLAFLGPPEIAGVGLAVSEINAAGGVDGADACHQMEDSGDSTDMSVSTASAGTLVSAKPSVVIGAASSSVSLNFVDTLTDAKITQVSPANTAVDLSGYDPFYFRTAPPDTIQGNALGTLITSDGYQRVAFIVFNDTYGTGLRNYTQETIEANGGEVVYGAKGEGDEFPAGQTTFSAEVTAALNANPDAIVVLAFDESTPIIKELDAQGWDMSKTYFTDGNLSDYSDSFDPGLLEGAQGTLPGNDPDEGFKDRLIGWYDTAEGEHAEGLLLRRRVLRRGDPGRAGRGQGWLDRVDDGPGELRGRLRRHRRRGVHDVRRLRGAPRGWQEIRYAGPSGIGPINEQNDPSSAFIGIYTVQRRQRSRDRQRRGGCSRSVS